MLFPDVEKLKATGHYVLIEIEKIEEKSAGGILINPGKDRELYEVAQEIGTILDKGPSAFDGRAIVDDSVKVGLKVMFKKYKGYMFRKNGKVYRIIEDEDIILKIEE